jgi:hypothetical protein
MASGSRRDGNCLIDRHRLLNKYPRLASGILRPFGTHGRLRQLKDRHIESEEAWSAVVEALPDNLRSPCVERVEGKRGIEVGDLADSGDANEVREADRAELGARCLGRIKEWQELGLHAGAVLVEVGRVEQELRMLGPKKAALLRDAALAQDHSLPSRGEGFADDGPFFEGNGQN